NPVQVGIVQICANESRSRGSSRSSPPCLHPAREVGQKLPVLPARSTGPGSSSLAGFANLVYSQSGQPLQPSKGRTSPTTRPGFAAGALSLTATVAPPTLAHARRQLTGPEVANPLHDAHRYLGEICFHPPAAVLAPAVLRAAAGGSPSQLSLSCLPHTRTESAGRIVRACVACGPRPCARPA